MAQSTSNYNLKKPGQDDFYNIDDFNQNADIIDAELKNVSNIANSALPAELYTATDVLDKIKTVDGSGCGLDADLLDGKEASAFATAAQGEKADELDNLLKNGVPQSPALAWGMNHIQIPEVPVSPTIEFEGFDYVNLLGKDGNCENLTNWTAYDATQQLNNNEKVFGRSSINVISNGTNTEHFAENNTYVKLEPDSYYFLSGYIKTIIGKSIIRLLVTNTSGGYDTEAWTTVANDTSKFTRVFTKFHTGSTADKAYFRLQLMLDESTGLIFSGPANSLFDGVMLNKLTAAEYASSLTDLDKKYPYGEGYVCLTNPYFENRRYNLIRNGNCEEGIGYWKILNGTGTLSIEDNKFKLVTTASYTYWAQIIDVEPNTSYTLSGNWSGNGFFITLDSNGRTLFNNIGAFNTGNNIKIYVILHGGTTAGTTYFDSVMLVKGSITTTEYKTCDLQRFAVEGQFAKGDKVKIENKKVTGLLNTKHVTLYGKNFDWQFNIDYTGYKVLALSVPTYFSNIKWDGTEMRHVSVKYDGKILKRYAGINESNDGYALNGSLYYICIQDSDSGWAESINPNNDEVKAVMNGWKVINHNGTRYDMWVNIANTLNYTTTVSAFPPGTASKLTVETSLTNSITVEDASLFKVGDRIFVIGNSGTTITNIVGNVITVSGNQNPRSIGTVVAKASVDTVNYCKNNIAPGYEGYKLHYKLANPEPITDTNVHVEGEIWDLVKGDNYVYVDSGIVLDEVTNPLFDTPNNFYRVNNSYGVGTGSYLRNEAEVINIIYKNDIYNNDQWIIRQDPPAPNIPNGRADAVLVGITSLDTNATYTADYQILKTLHVQRVNNLTLSYKQSILSTLEGNGKSLEQKQPRDSVLDEYIDLSIYREITSRSPHIIGKSGSLYIDFVFEFVPMKCRPILTVKQIAIVCNSIPIVDKIYSVVIFTEFTDIYVVRYVFVDTTTITNIKSNGVEGLCRVSLDCRGRV